MSVVATVYDECSIDVDLIKIVEQLNDDELTELLNSVTQPSSYKTEEDIINQYFKNKLNLRKIILGIGKEIFLKEIERLDK